MWWLKLLKRPHQPDAAEQSAEAEGERDELVRHQQETAERMQHLQDLEREMELLRRRSRYWDDGSSRYH